MLNSLIIFLLWPKGIIFLLWPKGTETENKSHMTFEEVGTRI